LRDRKACAASGRFLSLAFVAILLMGAATTASHSHADGQIAASTCLICHVADSDASPAMPSASPSAQSPEVSIAESPSASSLRDRLAIDDRRARSPPA
jgi:hypothetical protein